MMFVKLFSSTYSSLQILSMNAIFKEEVNTLGHHVSDDGLQPSDKTFL